MRYQYGDLLRTDENDHNLDNYKCAVRDARAWATISFVFALVSVFAAFLVRL